MLEARTETTWFMRRHWTQEGNLKVRAELGRPDTNQAEQWLTPDLFLFKGKLWKVLFDGRVINGNGHGAQGVLL